MEYVNLTLAAALDAWNRVTSRGIEARARLRGDRFSPDGRWTAAWLAAGGLVGAIYIRLVDYQLHVTG
ncbi:MAG: hypothetical protein KDA63_10515 [Planctomycetales bacterium]|nr:hypothetical protein [Planctomycetales bacterium]